MFIILYKSNLFGNWATVIFVGKYSLVQTTQITDNTLYLKFYTFHSKITLESKSSYRFINVTIFKYGMNTIQYLWFTALDLTQPFCCFCTPTSFNFLLTEPFNSVIDLASSLLKLLIVAIKSILFVIIGLILLQPLGLGLALLTNLLHLYRNVELLFVLSREALGFTHT